MEEKPHIIQQQQPVPPLPRPQSRVISSLNIPQTPQVPQISQAPPSPRLIQNPSTDKVKLIQIPQDDYQQFIDHLPICKKSQE